MFPSEGAARAEGLAGSLSVVPRGPCGWKWVVRGGEWELRGMRVWKWARGAKAEGRLDSWRTFVGCRKNLAFALRDMAVVG